MEGKITDKQLQGTDVVSSWDLNSGEMKIKNKFDLNLFIGKHLERFGVAPTYQIVFYACEKHYRSEIEKLQLENTVLKEKLEIAESQIEDLKSQIAYWENQ